MATWPDNLPGPCRTISIQAGNNTVVRKLQSGRREVRRFGAAAPDRATVQFRLFNKDVAAFEYFFDRQTNLGANWFSAPWLPALGYDDHRARILGYPKRKAKGTRFSDYSVNLLIAETAYVPEDVFWLSAGTGGSGGGSTVAAGELYTWGGYSTYNDVDSGIEVTKVVYVRTSDTTRYRVAGVALQTDGTLYVWGESNTISNCLDGYASLGSIVDIHGVQGGLFYITSTGGIGYLGTPLSYVTDDIPNSVGFVNLVGDRRGYAMGAIDSDGLLTVWGHSSAINDYPTDQIIPNPRTAGFGGYFNSIEGCTYLVNDAGALLLLGVPPALWPDDLPESGIVCAGGGGLASYSAFRQNVKAYQENGSFYEYVYASSYAFYSDFPAGLIPQKIEGDMDKGVALHSDGQIVTWGNATAPDETIYAQDFIFFVHGGGSSYRSYWYAAILTGD